MPRPMPVQAILTALIALSLAGCGGTGTLPDGDVDSMDNVDTFESSDPDPDPNGDTEPPPPDGDEWCDDLLVGTPGSIDFGEVAAGSDGRATVGISVTHLAFNGCSASITALSVEDGLGRFFIDQPPGLPVNLSGDDALTVALRFSPEQPGVFAASLRVVAEGPGGRLRLSVPLSGSCPAADGDDDSADTADTADTVDSVDSADSSDPDPDLEPDRDQEPEPDGDTSQNGCPFPADPAPAGNATGPPDGSGIDWLLISAPGLTATAGRLAAHRTAQGYAVTHTRLDQVPGVSASNVIEPLTEHLCTRFRAARSGGRQFMALLAGGATRDDEPGQYTIPFTAWDGSSTFYGDNGYADCDGNDLPDFPIGRLPFDTTAGLSAWIDRAIDYESGFEPGEWNSLINMFAGSPGFGELEDMLIEQVVYLGVEDVPYEYRLTMAYGNENSSYCYAPSRFSDHVIDLFNAGSLAMAYVGHGWEEGLDDLAYNGRSYDILDTADLGRIDIGNRYPLLFLFACSTGAVDNPDSLTGRALALTGGPVAVISSTDISHPYSNGLLAHDVMASWLGARLPRLGDVFVAMKRELIGGDSPFRRRIDNLATLLLTREEMADLNVEHLYMYNLYSDPALWTGLPDTAGLAVRLDRTEGEAGGTVEACIVAGPGIAGQTTVDLEIERGEIIGDLVDVRPGTAGWEERVTQNWAISNDKLIERRTITLPPDGRTAWLRFAIPADAPIAGYHVTARNVSGGADHIGSASFEIRH